MLREQQTVRYQCCMTGVRAGTGVTPYVNRAPENHGLTTMLAVQQQPISDLMLYAAATAEIIGILV